MIILVQPDFSITLYFKTVFPTYTEFETFLETYTNCDKTDVLHAYIYKYLFNRYCNSNVNYDTASAFMRHFGVTYENFFTQFKKRKDILTASYALTNDDINTVQKVINAIANNNSTVTPNALDNLIDYVDQQTASKITNNKLQSYTSALMKLTDNFLLDYMYKFTEHFMQILVPQIDIYEE